MKTIGDVERCCEIARAATAILSRRGCITACQDWSEFRCIILSVLETGSTSRGGVRTKESDLCAYGLEDYGQF